MMNSSDCDMAADMSNLPTVTSETCPSSYGGGSGRPAELIEVVRSGLGMVCRNEATSPDGGDSVPFFPFCVVFAFLFTDGARGMGS